MVRAPVDTRGLPAILLAFVSHTWGYSSAGRAPAWHAGGRGFEPPYLHHSTPYTSLSRSGTDFQPRHLTLIFREPPVDNHVSNSQVDAFCESMHDFQLAFSVKTVKEWLEIRQHIRHLFQLRLFLLDFRPFLQCFMLQRPEHGNAVSHLLNGNLRNRKSSLELSDVSVVLGDLSIRLYQPVGTIEFGHEVVQFLAELVEKHRKQVVFQQLSSASLLPVSSALAGILGLVALRTPVSAQKMFALRAVDRPAEEGQRKPLTPVRTHAKFLLQAKPFIELENRLDTNIVNDDLLSNVPVAIQKVIEAKVDTN